MRRALATRPGPASAVVELVDAQPEPVTPGDVTVRMLTTTVNPSDLITISGAYASRTTFPFVPGFEGAGEIVAAGPQVDNGLVGQRVIPIGGAGNWQQYRTVPASWCFPIPSDIPDTVATFAYINPVTALLMVDGHVPAGTRTAVITAAGSAIGGQLADLLRARGVAAIGLTTGRALRPAADAGRFTAIVDRRDPDWPDALTAAAGGPADVVFDCVGGADGPRLLSLLRPGGQLVHFGLLSGVPLTTAGPDVPAGRSVHLFRLRDRVYEMDRSAIQDAFDRVFAHLRAGRLGTPIAADYSLDDLGSALRRAETQPGKILIQIGR
ncbi:zinc-dependent alcohol dehydrogenase family protein [Actinoplanes siamensis]|uniref:Oxidoreductase n=1 Tax=Actinoplanes siamensis TaxID=1223317 RepID=A0A919N9W7_9ACTN|nr:zinc-dependent alcohol dehydrogenase family protein [Actinoplanes siamensis]GIF06977.1 oxidoreductase [Actinoplanes siamensis]